MMRTLYNSNMLKGMSQDEAMSNSEKSSPYVTFAIIKLHLYEGIRQAVSQSVESSI